MRRATHDAGWLVHPDHGGFYGLAMGFEFCAEHEYGAPFLQAQMGLDGTAAPIGVDGRTQTQVPPALQWVEYLARPNDKRFKGTQPAALLYCCDSSRYESRLGIDALPAPQKAARLEVPLYRDWNHPQHTETDDLAIAWSGRGGFAVHARGAEGVAQLRELHEAFLAGTVSMAAPGFSLAPRGLLSLVITPKLSEAVKAEVLARDVAHQRLLSAVAASGIEQELHTGGKSWCALTPDWRDGEGSELLFCLNPCNQKRYSSGWFTLPELRQWAQNKGPVCESDGIRDLVRADSPDWSIHLLRGLQAQGIGLRVGEAFVWLEDEQKNVSIGVRLLVSKDTTALNDGTYHLSQLRPYVDAGLRLGAAQA